MNKSERTLVVSVPEPRSLDIIFTQEQKNISSKTVRRQNFWLKLGRGLAECLARPGVDVLPRSFGASSVDVRWFVVWCFRAV